MPQITFTQVIPCGVRAHVIVVREQGSGSDARESQVGSGQAARTPTQAPATNVVAAAEPGGWRRERFLLTEETKELASELS